MALLPQREGSRGLSTESRILELNSAEADVAFETLTSETTRTVLSIVYEQPSLPSEIRDEIDTSLQNVHYHLQKLEEGELIEPVGTSYSKKGREMTMYAPAYDEIVLVAGRDSTYHQVEEFIR